MHYHEINKSNMHDVYICRQNLHFIEYHVCYFLLKIQLNPALFSRIKYLIRVNIYGRENVIKPKFAPRRSHISVIYDLFVERVAKNCTVIK